MPTRRLALALLLLPAPALANPAIGEDATITEGLVAAAMAYEIGERCDGVSARILRGLAFLEGLRDRARSLGFSNDEIDAFVDDDAQQDRIEALARARFAALGGVDGDPESYCAVGRAEIARGTQVGALLRD